MFGLDTVHNQCTKLASAYTRGSNFGLTCWNEFDPYLCLGPLPLADAGWALASNAVWVDLKVLQRNHEGYTIRKGGELVVHSIGTCFMVTSAVVVDTRECGDGSRCGVFKETEPTEYRAAITRGPGRRVGGRERGWECYVR